MKNSYIRQYMNDERVIRKKYRNWTDMFLFGLFAFLTLIFCIMFGISQGEGEGRITDDSLIIYIFMLFSFFTVFMLCHSTLKITEGNKQVNIFNKYLFVPRRLQDIFMAKLLVIIKDTAVLTAVGQTAALLANLAVNKGKFVIFLETFAPVISGVVSCLCVTCKMWVHYKKAKMS